MTTYLELHVLQSLPPSNINRDDTGAPKTATYGGVLRPRVSSQSWKRAIRKDFENRLPPEQVGTRTKQVVEWLRDEIEQQAPELSERAESLAGDGFRAAGFKLAKPRNTKVDKPGVEELGYLIFLSAQQVRSLAAAVIEHADAPDVEKALKAAKVKDLLDREHSIDMALFGRMVAEAPDINVDAACQVAHALGVHELTSEYDYFTAVDDRKEDAEETGAGMIGTVEFNASTLYRYAVVNVDQLQHNLGNADATRLALEEFVRSFVSSMPTGKQNTFAHGTWPYVVMVTVGTGQPSNLVGAFEDPVRPDGGYVLPAARALAAHANDVFGTWRTPSSVLVTGLAQGREALAQVDGAVTVTFDQLPTVAAEASMAGLEDR